MVFSMNVFKNKKRWKNKKNVKKRLKKRALNKKRKNVFFTSMEKRCKRYQNRLTNRDTTPVQSMSPSNEQRAGLGA